MTASEASPPEDRPRWEWNGSIPLQRCGITLEVDPPLLQVEILSIGRSHKLFKAVLPRRSEQNFLTVQLGSGMVNASQPGASSGWLFELSTDTGKQRKSLAVAPLAITFLTFEYSRWAEVWSEVETLLRSVLGATSEAHRIKALNVDFINRFFWLGDPPSALMRGLLKESAYLPLNALAINSLWHSHHGFIRLVEAEEGGEFLENINVQAVNATFADPEDDLNPGSVRRCLDTVLSYRFIPTAGAEIKVSPDDVVASVVVVGRRLSQMRDRNKAVLRDLLLPEIVDRVPGLEVK